MPADAGGHHVALANLEVAGDRVLDARMDVCDAHESGAHSPECSALAEVQIAIERVRVRIEDAAERGTSR